MSGLGKIGEVRVEVKVDPKGIAPGIEAARVEAAAGGKAIGDALGEGIAGGSGGHGGILGGLRKARQKFHHAVIGLFAIPMIVEHAVGVGEKIGDAILVGLGRAGTEAIKQLDAQIEATQKKIIEAQGKMLAKSTAPGAPFDAEGILAKQKAIKDATEKITKAQEMLNGAKAQGYTDDVKALQEYIDHAVIVREQLEKQVSVILAKAKASNEAAEVAKAEAEALDKQQKRYRELEASAKKIADEEERATLAAHQRIDDHEDAQAKLKNDRDEKEKSILDAVNAAMAENAKAMADALDANEKATARLTEAVEDATDAMRNQQSEFLNSLLGSMSVDLRELRSITQLRSPRR